MNTNNPVRKSIILIVVFFIAFTAMITMACDENPITACVGATASFDECAAYIPPTIAPSE